MNKQVIEIKQDTSTYHLEDERFICDHNSTTIEKACCKVAGPSGHIECGCGGMDSVVCDNVDCTGLDEDSLPEINNDCWG